MPRRTPAPSLTDAFLANWRYLGGPDLTPEYRFAPPRMWRVDFFHPSGCAVELEGGVWSGGRHVSPQGFEGDVLKYNALSSKGLRLWRVTRKLLDDDPVGLLTPIIQAMRENQ